MTMSRFFIACAVTALFNLSAFGQTLTLHVDGDNGNLHPEDPEEGWSDSFRKLGTVTYFLGN